MSDINVWDPGSWGVIRKVRGISYCEIAKACQVHDHTPQKWFTGATAPTLSHQLKLARVLGISLEDALSGVSDPDVRSAIRYALNND
ncbi:helix-turn-helix domain-containing protein [Streptomyces lancefieldiae]|uniref:Helix-turn-helix transcriptional regulator n=1 Tax=Streptomyces lancefieldiae TaxID=3075520 RepID=A0ABU3APY1_9ACTN|nr:helix-turn-helix transcriptional regulator [Streptomyces sp. DSM 40712]MDT0611984.1 helix-turn-helix transcriptional regulator [Streptomyces sp. DSM 40712]